MTLIAAGAMASGGLTSLAMSKFLQKERNKLNQENKMKNRRDGIENKRTPNESSRESVSETEWLVTRKDLLAWEKEFTRQRDALSAARRQLPMVKIDKEYVFDGPKGKETLADLFDGHSQLMVYHFMFGPGLGGGLQKLFLSGGSFRRRKLASPASRRQFRGDLTRTAGGDSILSKTHGLAFQMAVVAPERLQFRLSRFVHERGREEGKGLLQLCHAGLHQRRTSRA
jgi:hypothetical protein